MPRSFKLTWQPGGSNRAGRWKKKYRGQSHYFPGGRGKSDREAYDAAWSAWEQLKVQLDRSAPRLHQRDYEAAMGQWEAALAWSQQHGDEQTATLATEKLQDLRRRSAAAELKPLSRNDWFGSQFDLPTVTVDWLPPADASDKLPTSASRRRKIPEPLLDELDGTPRRLQREIWHDRLAMQARRAAPVGKSVREQLDLFLSQMENTAKAGQVSVGRCYAVRLQLQHFQDWFGKEKSVEDIEGTVLINYHSQLLKKVASEDWSRTTASHYLSSLKSFVRWLWQTDAIAALPRVMDGRSKILNITKPTRRVVVFTKAEIRSVLAQATGRTKLYILLMLNCGMTQKDISDLRREEVDWQAGRIIRKRSKTADCEQVPVVNYQLWPETFRLLRKERAGKSQQRVLLNANGGPLWSESLTAAGKYQKADNIKNAFDRLRKLLNIKKPLKSFKKTSATLLRDSSQFSSLESLFLGHAPQSMADKHYTKTPQKLLDQAVRWLGKQYGIE